MMTKRFHLFLNLLLGLMLLPTSHGSASEAKPEGMNTDGGAIRFTSTPDLFNWNIGNPQPGWEETIDWFFDRLKAEGPDFNLNAGDIMDARWWESPEQVETKTKEYWTGLMQRYQERELAVYIAPGDHQYGDDGGLRRVKIARAFARQFTDLLGMPRNGPADHLGRAYYVRKENLLVVTLDTFEDDDAGFRYTVGPSQLAWLEGVLKAHGDAEFVIVQGHLPIIGPVESKNSSASMLEGGEDSELWRVMVEHGVDVYLCGEHHRITVKQHDGIWQIVHGALWGTQTDLNYLRGLVRPGELRLELLEFDVSYGGEFIGDHPHRPPANRPREEMSLTPETREHGPRVTGTLVLNGAPDGATETETATGWFAVEPTRSADKPNILVLSFEDTSASAIGCYGNPDVATPVMDGLAARGLRFTSASSNAPQCSPARGSLISGAYATTYGTDQHRRAREVPDDLYYFTPYLREAGYFLTKNQKQDYNNVRTPAFVWDENSTTASYNSPERALGQPFFAVFNSMVTHMGRVRSITTDERRPFGAEGLNPDELSLPPYLPDLPEIRSDYAFHLEGVQDVDRWVEFFLDDLQERGLSENTIIFVFSDHGGCLPRGKGFVYETGLRVPLIVYFPERWKHLANGLTGSVDRLVSFVDLAPTFLSLAGVATPPQMQGTAFLGAHTGEEPRYQYGFRCNQAWHYAPQRSVSDGRFKLIRNYLPHKPHALRNFYQWGMPANLAWDRQVLEGGRSSYHAAPGPLELYDLQSDPYETENLADDPDYADHRERLIAELNRHVRSSGDLGFFLPSEREKEGGLYAWVEGGDYPLETLWQTVELCGLATADDLPRLLVTAKHEDSSIRYWSLMALAHAAKAGVARDLPASLRDGVNDANSDVAAASALAFVYGGEAEAGIRALVRQLLDDGSTAAYSNLEALTWSDHREEMLAVWQDLPLEERFPDGEVPRQVRSILINLGLVDLDALYSELEREEGRVVNRDRRGLYPKP